MEYFVHLHCSERTGDLRKRTLLLETRELDPAPKGEVENFEIEKVFPFLPFI